MNRYGLTPEDLKRLSKMIQMGRGIADRISQVDGTTSIEDASTWAEQQVSVYVGVPLKPVPVPGETTVPNPPARENFPIEFTQGVLYYALSRILASEFFENQPNVSESAKWCEQQARVHLLEFRSRSTVLVGAGRRRHPNPFMPPNIAPPEKFDQNANL